MTTRRDVDLFLKSGNDIMRPRVRISRVSTIVVDADDRDWLFVRVDTDEPGLVGWGESSLGWHTRAVRSIVDEPLRTEGGYALPPTRPGIGVELIEKAASAHPGRSPRPHLRFAPDGGLLDW